MATAQATPPPRPRPPRAAMVRSAFRDFPPPYGVLMALPKAHALCPLRPPVEGSPRSARAQPRGPSPRHRFVAVPSLPARMRIASPAAAAILSAVVCGLPPVLSRLGPGSGSGGEVLPAAPREHHAGRTGASHAAGAASAPPRRANRCGPSGRAGGARAGRAELRGVVLVSGFLRCPACRGAFLGGAAVPSSRLLLIPVGIARRSPFIRRQPAEEGRTDDWGVLYLGLRLSPSLEAARGCNSDGREGLP